MLTVSSALPAEHTAEDDYWHGRPLGRVMHASRDEAEYFAGEIGEVAGLDVLEIGFGAGAFLAWARDRGARVAGIEASAICRRNAGRHGVPLLPADMRRAAQAAPAAFDLIVALDVLEHLDADCIGETLASCAAMLRPGGRMIVRFPNCASPLGSAYQHADADHRTALSACRLDALIGEAPLRVNAIRRPYRAAGRGLAALSRLMRHVAQSLIERTIAWAYHFESVLSPNIVVVLNREVQKLRETCSQCLLRHSPPDLGERGVLK